MSSPTTISAARGRVQTRHGHLFEAPAGNGQRLGDHPPHVDRLGRLGTGQGHGDELRLVGQLLRVVGGEEHLGDLEQPHTR